MNHRLKEFARAVAYYAGTLGLLHRIRNRRTLTVFMFHRVLPAGSLEYSHAEREFTMSTDGFGKCLDFIAANYNVVSHAEVRSHRCGASSLPNRAALITFDDGWRDTLTYAQPELKRRALPAVLFLATEALELTEDRWWQDMLVEALGQPGALAALEAELGLSAVTSDTLGDRIRRLTATIGNLDDQSRHRILKPKVIAPTMPRQMMSASDLQCLRGNFSISGHGHRHVPLSFAEVSALDIAQSKRRLAEMGADDWAMSLPHGAGSPRVFEEVFDAGFECCYTSEPTLFSLKGSPTSNSLIGRIHIPENQWTCECHGISAKKLATFLFLRPIAS